MKEIIQNVINSGVFNLTDILKKIDTLWVQSQLSDEERTQLIQMAQDKADPTHGHIDIQDQVDILFGRADSLDKSVADITATIETIKKAISGMGGSVTDPEPEPEPGDDEYPEWTAWPGYGAILWQNGSKCSHNSKKWVSRVDNNIWEPGGMGVSEAIWEEVKE